MKILMLTDRMESGGAETHLETLTLELAKRGHEVSVLSCGGRIADRLEEKGIKQYRFPWEDGWVWWLKNARRAFKNAIDGEAFDVYHAHTRRTAFLMERMVKRNGNGVTVVTVHAAFFCNPLLKKAYAWGERTICVSEDLRAAVCDVFDVPAEAVTVIPNGIDCNLFSAMGRESQPETILFASRLDEDCSVGARLLCEIAPRLKSDFSELRIRIAGGGNCVEKMAELAKKTNRLCGENTVTVLGTVTDMASEYRKNSIFVGVSRAAMEAAACGCAVILCGDQGYGGILSSKNPIPALSNFCCRGENLPNGGRLEQDLRYLLEDRWRLKTIAESGRRWMRESFEAAGMAKETEAVYRQ